MWLDIIVAVIFVYSAAQGLRKGFARTFLHAIGWILSVVIGYASYAPIVDFLKNKTGFYDLLLLKVTEKISSGANGETFVDGLPQLLRETAQSLSDSLASTLAAGITEFLFRMICFLLVVLIVRWIILGLSVFFSVKQKRSVTGFIDGSFGLLAGVVKGVMLIFVILALMVPIIGLSKTDTLYSQLQDSTIASMLYDNNLLFLMVDDFIEK